MFDLPAMEAESGIDTESRFPGWTHSLRLSGAPSSVKGQRIPGLWLTSHQALGCPGQRAALLWNKAPELNQAWYNAGCSSQGREGDEQGTPASYLSPNNSDFFWAWGGSSESRKGSNAFSSPWELGEHSPPGLHARALPGAKLVASPASP